jgi:dUTP pyrophosphatase
MLSPTRGTAGSAGWDLRYFGWKTLSVLPGKTATIRTGTHFQPPPGYYGLLDTRSSTGKNLKMDLMCRTIDQDYTGEVHLILRNEGDVEVEIEPFNRLCQIVFLPYLQDDLTMVSSLENFEITDRGSSGFGSTGRG